MASPSILTQLYTSHPTLSQVFIALMTILLYTRIVSGRKYKSWSLTSDLAQELPTLPYWVPFFGHFFQLLNDWQAYLGGTSTLAPSDRPFAVLVLGQKVVIVPNQILAETVSREHAVSSNSDLLTWRVLVNVFGARPNGKSKETAPPIVPKLDNNDHVSVINAAFQTHIPDLVSFSESPVDMSPWERPAGPIFTQQPYGMKLRPAVEVSLMELITSFVGHVALTAILGRDFMEVNPSLLEDLKAINDGFKFMVLGFPRWVPLPGLSKAYFARRRLLFAIRSFHSALDAEDKGDALQAEWGDLSDVSKTMKDRRASWRAQNAPQSISSSVDLAFIWNLHARLTSLTCWMLLHIWAKPELADRIRQEMNPYLTMTQKPQFLGISEPLGLRIDREGVLSSCPLLKSCFLECIRLYCALWLGARASTDLIIPLEKVDQSQKHLSGSVKRSVKVHAGSYIVRSLGQAPSHLEKPEKFNYERWLDSGAELNAAIEEHEKGADSPSHKGPTQIEEDVCSIVAGILAVWDLSPVHAEDWNIPQPTASSSVRRARRDVRVFVARRELEA